MKQSQSELLETLIAEVAKSLNEIGDATRRINLLKLKIETSFANNLSGKTPLLTVSEITNKLNKSENDALKAKKRLGFAVAVINELKERID